MFDMRDLYLGLKFTFSYFSILPIYFSTTDNLTKPSILGFMLFFLPLVGLVLGGMSIALYILLEHLAWYAGLIAAISYMMLYGFIHTEAIIDVADALYAKHSGKDAYAVIKDPTVGAMGVLWGISMLLVKIAGVMLLLTAKQYALFLSVLIISRLGLLLLVFSQDFRSSFLDSLQEAFKPKYFITSMMLFIIVGLYMITWKFLLLLSLGLMLSYLIASSLKKQLGFINGDVLGTTLESVEILLLICISILWL